jgi:hypothetical protein
MKLRNILFLTFLIFFFLNCHRKAEPVLSLLENKQPLFVCGEDNSGHYYKFIKSYIVDQNGKIFLWDMTTGEHIDVYDDKGQFLFQFGRKGEGPGEFRGVANGAIDSQGNIWINSDNMKSLKIYSERGEYKEEVTLPKEIAISYIKKMVFDAEDDLILLCYFSAGNKFSLYRFIIKENRCHLIHSDSKRIRQRLADFMPDFTLDAAGNLYITDTLDYRIYKYSKDGKLLYRHEVKGFKKEHIVEKDFNIFNEDFKIIRYPGYKEVMGALRGPSLYFPAIFGINIEGDTIYVWTSKQDEMKRFLIDVYDIKFNRRCRSCYFNWMGRNLAQIVKGKLYIPSIENENIQLTKHVGRFTMLNYADQLKVYAISKELSGKN